MLKQLAALAPGSTIAVSFYLPTELLDEEDKPLQQIAEKGALAAGTPFISFFTPDEIRAAAHEAGFTTVTIISAKDIVKRYFIGRTDGLLPASGEIFLVATM